MHLNRYHSSNTPQFNQYYRSYGQAQKPIDSNQYYQNGAKKILHKRSDSSAKSKPKSDRQRSNQPKRFQTIMQQFNQRKQNYLRNRNSQQPLQSPIYSSPDFIFKMKIKIIEMSQNIRLSRTDILKMYDLSPQKVLEFFMQKVREQLTYFARQSYSFRNEQQKFFQNSVQKYQELHKTDNNIKNKLYRQNHTLRKELRQKQNALSILRNQLAVRTLQARSNGAKIVYGDKQTAINEYEMIISKLEQRVIVLSKFIDQAQRKKKQKNEQRKKFNGETQKSQQQMQDIVLQSNQRDQQSNQRDQQSNQRYQQSNQRYQHSKQRDHQVQMLRNSIVELKSQNKQKLQKQIDKYERKLFEKQQRILQLQENANKASISHIKQTSQSQLPIQTNPHIKQPVQLASQASQTEHNIESVSKNNKEEIQKIQDIQMAQQKKHQILRLTNKDFEVLQQKKQSKRGKQDPKRIVINRQNRSTQDQKLFTEVNFTFSPNRKQLYDNSSILNDSFKNDEITLQRLIRENKRLLQENHELKIELKQWKQDFLKKVQTLKEDQNQKNIKQKSRIRYSFKSSSEGDSQKLIKLSKQWKQRLNQASAEYESQIKKLQIEVDLRNAQNNSLKSQFNILASKVKSERQKQHSHAADQSIEQKIVTRPSKQLVIDQKPQPQP